MDNYRKVYIKEIDETLTVNKEGKEIYLYGLKKEIKTVKSSSSGKTINIIHIRKTIIHVHSIVMRAFNPLEDYNNIIIIHKDGNPLNNNFDNLEYKNKQFICDKYLNNNRFSKSEKDDIIKLFKEGKKFKEIMSIYNISTAHLVRLKKQYCSNIIRKRNNLDNKIITKIRSLSKDHTIQEICKELSISKSTIYRIIKDNNFVTPLIQLKAQAIELLKTKTPKEVSELLNISLKQVYNWRKNYK